MEKMTKIALLIGSFALLIGVLGAGGIAYSKINSDKESAKKQAETEKWEASERLAQQKQEAINEETRKINLSNCLEDARAKQKYMEGHMSEERYKICSKGTTAYVVNECAKYVDKLIVQIGEDADDECQICYAKFGK